MQRITLVLVTCAGMLGAQNVATVPGDAIHVAPGSYSYSANFPYSYGVSRMMAIYEPWDISIPNGAHINAIGFRQYGTSASTGHALQLQVNMGTSNNNSSNTSSTFASNYITSGTSVFGPALFTLPNLPATGSGTVWLNLTTPYQFDNTHSLVVEWLVSANNNGNAAFSYYLDLVSYYSPVITGAAGCQNSAGRTATVTTSPVAIGNNWSVNIGSATASSLVFMLSTVNSGLVTPYSLAPYVSGIQNTCLGQLALNNLLVFGGTTDSGGNAYWNVAIPNNQLFYQNIIASQGAILDFFSPGGIAVSGAAQMQIGIAPAETVLYAQGSTTATTGGVNPHYGLVTMFQWQ
jgi:hypothetical protein